jgi:hypothetical protein
MKPKKLLSFLEKLRLNNFGLWKTAPFGRKPKKKSKLRKK